MKKKKGVHGYTLSIYLLHDAYVFQRETSFPASRHLDGLNCGAKVARCAMKAQRLILRAIRRRRIV